MIRINPIQLNNPNTKKNISFKNDTPKNQAILALQASNAEVKFGRDFRLTQGADAVQSNPISALGFKIYKTMKIFFGPKLDTKRSFSVQI